MKPVKLHLCSGDKHWPLFTNVDAHGEPDVVSDCKKLPFDSDYADEIHCIHGVEHFPRLAVDNMMVDWRRVLKPGGKLAIEVPCLNKIAQHIVNGEKNIRVTTLGIFGDPRDQKPAMLHQWCYTREELTQILDQAGFSSITVMEPVFHHKERDMRVEAIK